MKIGILTQPLHNNYGGLLQNYALQTVLKKMGHKAITIDRIKEVSHYKKIGSILKRLPLKLIDRNLQVRVWQTKQENEIIGKNTISFKKKNISTTHLISRSIKKNTLDKYQFDAFIVGSDQIWRPKYSPYLYNYFLDFVLHDPNKIRIAYAASFGVDKWELTKRQTMKCKELISHFDAVSLREDSGVLLCKQFFDINDAIHVLDPTMLLEKNDYINLISKNINCKRNNGGLFVYILDNSEKKSKIVNQLSMDMKIKTCQTLPTRKFSERIKNDLDQCIYPSVEDWLQSFIDADFIITDSFHGTVFALIFNKPFISVANKMRGTARMSSLLKLFKIEDRLISEDLEDLNEIHNMKEINFTLINNILQEERKKSYKFLLNNLINE